MLSIRDPLRSKKQKQGKSSKILDRVDSLIDELLNDSEMSSSSLASIMMAARESVRDGYHVALARRTWDAHNDLQLRDGQRSPELRDDGGARCSEGLRCAADVSRPIDRAASTIGLVMVPAQLSLWP